MGITAVAIFLFFPETQYERVYFPTVAEDSSSSEKQEASEEAVERPPLPPKRTFLQELKPWSKINKKENYFILLLRPWPMICYPATIYAFMAFSTTLAWQVSILTTYASIFQLPPYNMSTGISSLINICAIIGPLIGGYVGGWLTDQIAEWQARRNNGVYEPEARLLSLIPSFFIVPLGTLM
jgi:MFS family permease